MFGDFKNSKISEIEEKILKYWQEKKIFEKSVNRKAPKGDYVFYDGPPFATGLPHYGHILAGTIKDAIPRYQTMKGKRVERRWGWDCHGLPIENLIEQKLGLKTKKDIEKYGIGKFNEEARNSVLTYEDDWKKIIPKTGRWVDMKNAYRTLDPEYTESVWWIFKNLFDKKLIYEGYKSMHICPRCETTLSNFEVALGYKDIEDSSVWVKFELESSPSVGLGLALRRGSGQARTFVLAWTTTPWTLPGNVALAINPKIKYLILESKTLLSRGIMNGQLFMEPGNYIIAKDRVSELIREGNYFTDKKKEILGSDLIGKKYKPLFDYYAKDKNLENRENGWKIYPADFVKTDEGTGIVHIAPAFGADDMALGRKYKLPFIQHVGMDGRLKKEVREFAGLAVKPKNDHQSTDKKIIELLNKSRKLWKFENITHSYPHCWRCETPLLNYAASSWFVKVTGIKKGKNGLLENNQKINWVPKHIKDGRFGKGLEEAPDWAISRSRYWGAPLPVWQCPKCNKTKVLGSIQEIKNSSKKSGNNYFLMRHGEALHNIKQVSSASLATAEKHHLTPKGKEEVIKTAKKLQNKKINLILSSDFVRTKESAKIIAKQLELPAKSIVFDKRLREFNVGIFDGQNIEKYREFAPTREERFWGKPEKGENIVELKNRLMDFLYEIDSRYKNKNILVVSHEYPIWLLVAGAAGADRKKTLALKEGKDDFVKTGGILPLNFSPLPHNSNYELDLHRPYIDEIEFPCPHCAPTRKGRGSDQGVGGHKMKRVNYVFDCWFESGSMPYGQSHFPFKNKEKFKKSFPAEFIAEGVDMTRGWFYTLHVLGTSLFGKPAFKNVIVNGIVLAEDGQKMSKRLKNYLDPMEIVHKYGADALRYYLLSSPAVRAEDLNFSDKGVDEVCKKLTMRLANVYSFYEMYADKRILGKTKKVTNQNILDRWITARLGELIKEVSAGMEAYELDRAVRPIADFIDDLSTWYIRRSRERFKNEGKNKEAAVFTTYYVLNELSKIIAPSMPFIAEWLYLKLNGKSRLESVHLEPWPKIRGMASPKKLIEEMKEIRKFASLGLEAREKAGIKVRQPLQKLEIRSEKLSIKKNKELLKVLADEINVKEIIFSKKIGEEVVLDTRITPELHEQGVIREFTRLVQGLRQEAGYTPKDKIQLWLEIPTELENTLTKNLIEFKNKIGAKKIEFRKSDKFDAEIETKIESHPVWAGIKKN